MSLDSLYIFTGNDVTSYFRSAAYRIRVHFGSCLGRDFLITVQPILNKFTALETAIQGLRCLMCSYSSSGKKKFVTAAAVDADIDDSIKRKRIRYSLETGWTQQLKTVNRPRFAMEYD